MPTSLCTLALGREYVGHATRLLLDVTTVAPTTPVTVLSDAQFAFAGFPTVTATHHRQRSAFKCYHDKRFALAAALTRTESTAFVDADCRLVAPPEVDGLAAGVLLARGASPILAKYEREIASEAADGQKRRTTAVRRLALVRQAARLVGVDLAAVTFVPEQAVAVTREGADVFLATWGTLARFFELRGYTWGEGDAIGLAAAKAGWRVAEWHGLDTWLYKDTFFQTAARRASCPYADRLPAFVAERRAISDRARVPISRVGRLVGQGTRYMQLAVGVGVGVGHGA